MNKQALLHHAASHCSNCGADVSGNYCHECGQETVLHPPSAREFMHEFIGHYVAVEGKLWKSLGLLLFRPGQLTLEYIKGRRVRYVQPLRMYLTFSLIFFAILKYAMHDVNVSTDDGAKHSVGEVAAEVRKDLDKQPGITWHKSQDKTDAPAKAKADADADAAPKPAGDSKTAVLVKEDQPGEIGSGTDFLSKWVRPYNRHVADRIDHFGSLSFEEEAKLMEESFYHYAPYAIFFMMPFFALYLKILYLGTGRRYGEHLLFALHSNGFAFLAMSLMVLMPAGFKFVEFLLWLWLLFYLPLAMRRVYGGSRTLTALRWMVLMFLHHLSIGLALLGAVVFGVLH